MFGIQLVAIIFSLFMVYFASIYYKKGEINGVEFLVWVILWTGAILIAVFPDMVRTFSRTFMISRVFDLMVMGGFILVISMATKSYVSTKKTEKIIEKLIRDRAITNAKKHQKK